MSRQTEEAKKLARHLLDRYFRTTPDYLSRHHIQSYEQFIQSDLPRIIRANNPLILYKSQIDPEKKRKTGEKPTYEYKVEIYVGGLNGTALKIGTPTLALQNGKEIRALFPNEARIRNLTYQSQITADITIRITYDPRGPSNKDIPEEDLVQTIEISDWNLFQMPILLHSKYCLLGGKSADFIREAGECVYDQGGYFIIEGSEKVLVTIQNPAFNTLDIHEQKADPKIKFFASIRCLSEKTRLVKRITFTVVRNTDSIQVGIPFVRKPVPLYLLFRAFGIISDRDITRLILPDENSDETKLLEPLLLPSIREAVPFLDTYTAIQYIKTLTKGFSEEHVIDILYNQVFIHTDATIQVEGGSTVRSGGARVFFLAECVRKILRRIVGIDKDMDRDDIRNQRCLTNGFMIQQMFQDVYVKWSRAMLLAVANKYEYNKGTFSGKKFENLFEESGRNEIFLVNQLSDEVKKAFKGKWGTGLGEEKAGAIQAMSRLSYLDFVSHTRRVVLEFDTGMKLTAPRQLHTSQFGYFCTSETPGGASIGVTKNLTMLATFSTTTNPEDFKAWLFKRGGVEACFSIAESLLPFYTAVYVNGGIVGYTREPLVLTQLLKLFKRAGVLPAFSSVGFSYRERRVFVYLDDGRPMRPLIHIKKDGSYNIDMLKEHDITWAQLVVGKTAQRTLDQTGFNDPFEKEKAPTFEDYVKLLTPLQGAIEYVDPYEQNEAYIATFPSYIKAGETSHLEIHPSTILSLMTSIIPFANHNQSPRNQLGDSQSKQGLSMYATNFQNRYDNTANILCYGEAPLVRTLYYDYYADGQMSYGTNIVLAIASYTGYNQDDGILVNKTAIERGLFRSITFRSYEAFEEDDPLSKTKTRIAHPKSVPNWTNLKAGLDYTKLDDRGIIRVGEMTNSETVLVSRYVRTETGEMNDASVTPQVWTRGRVESIVVTVNNAGLQLIKIRITQDRIPELGDKFSNRHGQKGTIGMLLEGQDMPRTADGLVPDMMMNPHAIPSRMTIAQLLEMIFGKLAATAGSIGDGTIFMNEGDPSGDIGKELIKYGMEPKGNQILYNGQTGGMINSEVFIGNVFSMRLKHMVEDKWNARGAGRKEQRTHQPTGGRGNEGGLRIGEMERDALIGHGIMDFVQDTYLKRSDGAVITVCDGCGTQPIYNESRKIQICPLCDGPVKFTGNKEIVAPVKRSLVTFSKIQIPYAFQLVNDELQTYMNIGMRYITGKNATVLRLPEGMPEPDFEKAMALAGQPIPTFVPEFEEESAAPESAKAPKSVEETVIDVVTKGAPSVGEGVTATAVAALVDGIRQNSGTRFASAAPAPQVNQVTQQQVGVTALGPAVTTNVLSATPEEGVGEFEELAPLPRSRPAVSFNVQPQVQQQQQQQTQVLLPSAPNVAPSGQAQAQVTLPGALQIQQGGGQLMQPMTLQTVTSMPSVQVFHPAMGAQVPPTIVVDGMGDFAPPEQTGGRRSRAHSPAPQQPRSFSSSSNGQKEQVTSSTRITIKKLM